MPLQVSSQTPPPGVHTLIPGTCGYLTPHRRDFADVIKVKSLEIGRLSWIIWVGPEKCESGAAEWVREMRQKETVEACEGPTCHGWL